ncbi:hypothetical protein BA768_00875 [Chryseobacterium sp. CBo1]|uniref:hypothetical protein n=1 Tax=Chryseobacterium sp. CBo1 TaxID=1869230 RepID=UPI000810A19E|nr:hypothetical protein [Chryseobacterium sp. CBo1]OCK53141.1 hypothetical protein BA768_00875 [Chryseobacterium sp. CBo1]
MKKLLYILLAFAVISCSGTDDILQEATFQNNSSELQPDKIWVYYAELPVITNVNQDWNYKFLYENGLLKRMTGRLNKVNSGGSNIYFFSNDIYTNVSYLPNQVVVEHSEMHDGVKKIVHTLQNNKLIKSEIYNNYNEIYQVKNYSYEANKISVHTKWYSWDTYDTYFFDSNKNLIKSEKLELSGNVETKLTKTDYLNFDTAKNPYKKLSLLNENFFVKSLSENNYRKISYTTQYLPNDPQILPGNGYNEWTYQYNSDGQVVLSY